MLTAFNNPYFLLAFVLLHLTVALFIYPVWVGLTIVWLSALIYGSKYCHKTKSWPSYEKKLFVAIAGSYLLIGSFLKGLLVHDIATDEFIRILLNRVEHSYWAFATVMLLLPLTWKNRKNMFFLPSMLLLLGLVNLLGNSIEILEFALRSWWGLKEKSYYSDTIYDLLMNNIGGGVAIVCLSFFKSLNQKLPQ